MHFHFVFNNSNLIHYFIYSFIIITIIRTHECHPILIVISFDGFRSDYVNESLTPVMYHLKQNGVSGVMKSEFVTKTYPNHQSIATGLFEESHGIVNNEMFDPKWNEEFDVNGPSKWWDNGLSLPIWIANQLEDSSERYSGSMLWPGTHAVYRNVSIKFNMNFYDGIKMKWNNRIDIVISWLTNAFYPVNCVFVYFEDPDTTAHMYGPWSSQVMDKVRDADRAVGYLIKRLTEKHLINRTNFIILSDHGMAQITNDRIIEIDSFLNHSLYKSYGNSPVLNILPNEGHENEVYDTLKNASKHMNFTVYHKEEIPIQYHYRNNRRILPLLIVADEGYDIYQNKSYKPPGNVWGNHGYNNSLPSMRPLFIASGPAFKKKYVHSNVFENIDLYPLMIHILQLFPEVPYHNNGSFLRVYNMLIPPMEAQMYDTSTEKWFKFIVFIFCGFGILFFSGICFVAAISVGKSHKTKKSRDVIWESLASGLDIDLHSNLDISSHNAHSNTNNYHDDDIIKRAKRLQHPEETILLLQDEDEDV